MTAKLSPQMRRAIFFCLATTAIYLCMILGTLQHLESISGLKPFDMRPMGYTPTEANDLLAALKAEGRQYYLSRQLLLDTVYPALMAISLTFLFRLLNPRQGLKRIVSAGIALSWMAAAFDYLENILIANMLLRDGPVPDGIAAAASIATITKSLTTSAAALILLTLFVAGLASRARVGS